VGLLAIAGRERFVASIKVTFVWSIPCVTSHVNLVAFFLINNLIFYEKFIFHTFR
jgi:hypothetical protein